MNNGFSKIFSSSKVEKLVFILTFAFVLISLAAIYFKENYLLFLFPVFLLIVYLYFFSIETIFLLIALSTPLSINLSNFDARLSVSLPTEPLLAGLLLIFLLKSIYELNSWKLFWKNPITISFILYFIWIAITSLTSQMPLVSWKYFASHLWLIIPMYFFGAQLFFQKENSQRKFIIIQIIALAIVVIYTLIRHMQYHFGDAEGHWVMQPFFKDHAIYGSALAIFIPISIIFMTDRNYSFTARFFFGLSAIILTLGLVFSYSRAAWLGFFISISIGIIVKFKIKFKVIAIVFLTLIVGFIIFQKQIFENLQKNKQDSSVDIMENIKSISNISTDASNLERINRWNCAIRMAKDYPLTGTGPGTYQFLYAPYQFSFEKTTISTNAGTLGNAHSEFLGTMAEMGIIGLITFTSIVFFIFYIGFKTYSLLLKTDKRKANLILGLLLGLISYFTHAFLNNFLDTDKIAIPVWGFAAIIVANYILIKSPKNVKEKNL
ncbi:MAG: O-antigen ligase family protein [Bacteroidales bacterium]|nr:O-antigen ligase family protein [Bacteroidales bacterium]